jgi:hypothetical protein
LLYRASNWRCFKIQKTSRNTSKLWRSQLMSDLLLAPFNLLICHSDGDLRKPHYMSWWGRSEETPLHVTVREIWGNPISCHGDGDLRKPHYMSRWGRSEETPLHVTWSNPIYHPMKMTILRIWKYYTALDAMSNLIDWKFHN